MREIANGGINVGRVVLAGIVAGITFFVLDAVADELFVGGEIRAALLAAGKPAPQESLRMFVYILAFCAVFGVALVWLYAAIRPRFGAGPRTAVIAGLTAWLFFGAVDAFGWAPFGFIPVRVYLIGNIAWIVQTVIAAVIGCRFYREEMRRPAQAV